MELVLGIDNIIFISLLSDKLPKHQQKKARRVGLILALGVRILLLMGISWVVHLREDIAVIFNHGFSGRDIILLAGGLFLLYKTTKEIHAKVENDETHEINKKPSSLSNAVVQIILLDIVFSFDSILTAVGLVDNIYIMISAVVLSMLLMLLFASHISNFVNTHPTIKMLALSFLLMIGVMLVAEGFRFHVEKGYVYFAMAFSFGVELLNIKTTRKVKK
jgi:predicted tellurium resistance membrane protein TerC